MTVPPRAGVFVYAADLDRLAEFYAALLGMTRVHSAPGLAVLRSPDLQLIVNAMPPDRAAAVEISTPPVHRDTAAYKFFATVPSLGEAARTAAVLGGEVLPEQWTGPGFHVQNAVDPEGNIFQVREVL